MNSQKHMLSIKEIYPDSKKIIKSNIDLITLNPIDWKKSKIYRLRFN